MYGINFNLVDMVMKHLAGDYCLSNFFHQVIAAFCKSLW